MPDIKFKVLYFFSPSLRMIHLDEKSTVWSQKVRVYWFHAI